MWKGLDCRNLIGAQKIRRSSTNSSRSAVQRKLRRTAKRFSTN